MKNREIGFTLVELAVVIVIIGLLIGGVLSGRELIHAAQLRSDIKQFEKINAAVNTFQAKFNCLPGDCLNAANLLSGATNGDGDGKIATAKNLIAYPGKYNPNETVYINTEMAYAVDSLNRAGLIEGTPFDVTDYAQASQVGKGLIPMKSASDKGIVFGCGYTDIFDQQNQVYNSHQCSFMRVGVRNVPGDYLDSTGVYTPIDAFSVDSKIDDGMPLTGKSKAGMQYGDLGAFFISPDPINFDSCVSASSGNPYNITSAQYADRAICSLLLRASY